MEENSTGYRETFNATIGETIGQAVRIIGADPALLIPGSVILHHQRKAAAVRRRCEQEGLLVPPVMIVSITSRCNLACAGCYMHGRGERPAAEMSPALLASVADQAAGLGVSVIVIAGGEPLVRQEEIFRIAQTHTEILFPLFSGIEELRRIKRVCWGSQAIGSREITFRSADRSRRFCSTASA